MRKVEAEGGGDFHYIGRKDIGQGEPFPWRIREPCRVSGWCSI